ncbi:hypothetical protein XELAEV_18031668mg [Xenopus laevis]|uniref:Uncharacterized protein n=1 Tax=Xenopus laevis TaxID=8355 RepID=A0A974CP76_XENLA|nr:hypothetical protein XELAEV_18031668mg [Xenopus laevis]
MQLSRVAETLILPEPLPPFGTSISHVKDANAGVTSSLAPLHIRLADYRLFYGRVNCSIASARGLGAHCFFSQCTVPLYLH